MMAAVSSVPEHMKQRTREKQKPRQKAKGMCPMLRYQKEGSDREKGDCD